jgi:hypothetical protein
MWLLYERKRLFRPKHNDPEQQHLFKVENESLVLTKIYFPTNSNVLFSTPNSVFYVILFSIEMMFFNFNSFHRLIPSYLILCIYCIHFCSSSLFIFHTKWCDFMCGKREIIIMEIKELETRKRRERYQTEQHKVTEPT